MVDDVRLGSILRRQESDLQNRYKVSTNGNTDNTRNTTLEDIGGSDQLFASPVLPCVIITSRFCNDDPTKLANGCAPESCADVMAGMVY